MITLAPWCGNTCRTALGTEAGVSGCCFTWLITPRNNIGVWQKLTELCLCRLVLSAQVLQSHAGFTTTASTTLSLWSKCLHKQFRILPSSALRLLQTTKEIRCRQHQSITEWNFYVLYIFIYTQVCLGTRSNVWKYNEKNVDRNRCSVTILDDIVMCYINIYLCCENLKRQQKVDWLPQWQILMHIMRWMWRHVDEDAHALLEVNLPALEMF